MQRPPHHLHRVALRRPRGQGIQTDATPGVLHVSPDPLACVTAVVVCGEVQLFVAAVSPPQMVEQLLEALTRLLPEQRPRTAPSVVVEGGAALPEEAGDNGVDGGARAEEDASDLGGREPVEGEQRDVHPEPSTGLRFALHLDDEALAFLGGDGDILHVRSSLWWLDGCGVFTMPQRTAACSIILCIYLVCRRAEGKPS